MSESPENQPPATPDPATIAPLDVDGVRAIAVGTVLWAVALVVALALRSQLAENDLGWWIWVCLAGMLLGLPGLWFVRRRRAAYAAARAHA